MDPVRDLAEVVEYANEPLPNPRELFLKFLGHLMRLGFDGTEFQGKRDQPLLYPVVEIALQAPPRFVASGHDARPRFRKLGSGLGVRDGSRDQFRELADA